MYLIEPCCAPRHVMMLRDAIGNNGRKQFEGYGDLSLTELLPAILTRYSLASMMIVAPTLPDQAAEVIGKWMNKQMARRDGKGKIDFVSHLTIIASLRPDESPMASVWIGENPFGERLTLVDIRQEDTALLLPDFAIIGPVNMRYGRHFTATATTVPEEVDGLWSVFKALAAGKDAVTETPKDAEKHQTSKKKRPRKRSL